MYEKLEMGAGSGGEDCENRKPPLKSAIPIIHVQIIDTILSPTSHLPLPISHLPSPISPKIMQNSIDTIETVYKNLELLDRVDPTTSALYRESAQALLADPEISLEWRKAISERLNQANHELTVHSVGDDSY